MSPKQRQDWIFNELTKDRNVKFSNMFSEYLVMFGRLSEVTFNIDWKKAQARAEKHHQAINEAIVKESIKVETSIVKRAVLNKFERMEILSDIAKGKEIEGQIIMPSFSEKINAIKALNEMDGANIKKETKLNINYENDFVLKIIGKDD